MLPPAGGGPLTRAATVRDYARLERPDLVGHGPTLARARMAWLGIETVKLGN